MSGIIYIGCPQDRYVPGLTKSIDDALAALSADPQWEGWSHHLLQYDANNSLTVNDTASLVLQEAGPIVLFDPFQRKGYRQLRDKVAHKVLVELVDVYDSPSIVEALLAFKELHLEGEPRIPRKLAGALLLVNKLAKEKFWGGTRNKNYLKVEDLHKGRGFDESFRDLIGALIHDLLAHDILKLKSKRRRKYALNGDRMAEIAAALDDFKFQGRLGEILRNDTDNVSVRVLDGVSSEHITHERKQTI